MINRKEYFNGRGGEARTPNTRFWSYANCEQLVAIKKINNK